ncbi:NAD(P)H-dependent oxidoreductase [Algivirga pacifica]|uniref:NAD(P)H-dependent oxidoreductase n=1 Tax=Algivirga pacifica TaxID=1162670 RepID=A0ABP9DAZ6_9BACT
MKILAFAGSNSSTSINRQLVTYTSSLFSEHEVELLDLNDFEMPIYKADREEESGVPQPAYTLAEKVDHSDMILLSLAEHNGAYSAAFKNVFDWLSRVPERKAFGDKKIFLMATSPGARGGASVLEMAQKRFPYNGGHVIATFSLPNFYDNFKEGTIVDEQLKEQLIELVDQIKREGK